MSEKHLAEFVPLQWIHSVSIALLLLAVAVCAQPSGISAVRAIATLSNVEYLEGEPIWLQIDLTSARATIIEWNYLDVLGAIQMVKDDVPVVYTGVGLSDHLGGRDTSKVTERTFRIQLNSQFSARDARDQFGYSHLTPGLYVGHIEIGPSWPTFSFSVASIPADMQLLWTKHRAFLALAESAFYGINQADQLDSMSHMAQLYLQLPIGHPWKSTGLSTCTWVSGFCRQQWTSEDSLLSVALIAAMAPEPCVSSHDVVTAIRHTILGALPLEEQAAQLVILTRQLAPNHLQSALSWQAEFQQRMEPRR